MVNPHHLFAPFRHPLQDQFLLGMVYFIINRTLPPVVCCISVQNTPIPASQNAARLDGFLLQAVLDDALQQVLWDNQALFLHRSHLLLTQTARQDISR